jgi:hypothetical protein
MEKLWPSIASMNHAKKISTQNLINDINKKINKNFVTIPIIENTNEMSIQAAAVLWRPLNSNELEKRNERNRTNIQSYNNLMETLNSILKRDTL